MGITLSNPLLRRHCLLSTSITREGKLQMSSHRAPNQLLVKRFGVTQEISHPHWVDLSPVEFGELTVALIEWGRVLLVAEVKL